ncbi:hypothetical protein IPM19_02595 [bacterium]|nr:MAG: hypothetical protein IPM19_02595 [bacterium]
MAATQEHTPFYNVMPDVTTGTITKPKTSPVVATAPVSAKPAADLPQPPKIKSGPISIPPAARRASKKRFYIFLAIALFIIITATGAGFYLMMSNDQAEDNGAKVANNEEQANPDVTTPGEWLQRYFGAETCTELVTCGDKSDPDRDGMDNKSEYEKGTDPNNNDSDRDGIADGDEVLIFGSDPLISKTYREGTYTDSDFIKGGYDIQTNEPYTNERLLTIKTMIKQYGLHQPTLTTLGTLSFQLYEFTDPSQPSLPADLDLSPQAKLDRDSQRQSTIKKVGAALLKYQAEKKSYPPTDDFVVMADMVKSFNPVATNYNDPIARDPYVYGYTATSNNADFVLTYYSETQNQLIKYFAKDAQADAAKDTSKQADEQRKRDLENIAEALLTYSLTQIEPDSDKEFVFPAADKLRSSLIPKYMTQMPTDPISKLDYLYQVGPAFDTFTIKAQLQNPTTGTTGYMCNQDECKAY